jgi:hypothetical protein
MRATTVDEAFEFRILERTGMAVARFTATLAMRSTQPAKLTRIQISCSFH